MGLFSGIQQENIYVDTHPMADRINVVSNKVDMTTGAVVGMESAVIAQEKASTEQICGKLDVGFFNVVMSQIAQKMANESAKTRALAMELIQQQKALQNLQTRMTGDYNMISSRYAKLFGSLNQELKNRIAELDKPLIDYCSQNVKQLQNRIYNLVSSVPVLQSESLSASQAIAAAHIKSNAQELISTVADYIKNGNKQRNTTEMLWNNQIQNEEMYYIPIIIDEEDTEIRRNSILVKENLSLKLGLGNAAYQQIFQVLNTIKDSLDWKQPDERTANVLNQFLVMVEKAELPKRIKDMMMKMFNDNLKTL